MNPADMTDIDKYEVLMHRSAPLSVYPACDNRRYNWIWENTYPWLRQPIQLHRTVPTAHNVSFLHQTCSCAIQSLSENRLEIAKMCEAEEQVTHKQLTIVPEKLDAADFQSKVTDDNIVTLRKLLKFTAVLTPAVLLLVCIQIVLCLNCSHRLSCIIKHYRGNAVILAA